MRSWLWAGRAAQLGAVGRLLQVEEVLLGGKGVTVDHNVHTTAGQLLRQIRAGRRSLIALCSGLTEEMMICRPGPQRDWSVKDLIAHVTWWESYIMEGVAALLRGEKSQPAEHQDVLNQRAYEDNKDRPLADVLAAFHANWRRLETLISSLSDEQLSTPAHYPTYDGIELLPILEAGTVGHYPMHITDLLAYVERLRSSPY